MSIPGLPAVTPTLPPQAVRPPSNTAQAQPTGAVAPAPKHHHFDPFGAIQRAASNVGQWLLTPYLRQAGKIGMKEFVQPNASRPDDPSPAKFGLNYQELNFPSKDGTPLKGWYIPAANPTDQTVVLACGHGSQMGHEMSEFAPWLHKAGYNVVCFDFRNSGGSGGTQTTMGFEERADLNAAVSQAEAHGGKNIAVMGVSMGAATAIAEAGDDPRVKTIVADCPYDTLHNAIAPRVKNTTFNVGPFKNLHIPLTNWVSNAVIKYSETSTGHAPGSFSSIQPASVLPKLGKRPLFLIHGAADDSTPPGCSVALAKADPNAQLWLVPGAGHAHSYQTAPDQYQAKVLDFLGKTL